MNKMRIASKKRNSRKPISAKCWEIAKIKNGLIFFLAWSGGLICSGVDYSMNPTEW